MDNPIHGKYGLTLSEMGAVRTAKEVGAGQAIFKALEYEYAKEDRALKTNPQRDDTNLRNDYVYRLGRLEGLQFLLKLKEELEKLLYNNN